MTIRIVLNSAGVRQLLQEPGVKADLKERADRVAAVASAEMEQPEGMLVDEASDAIRARYVVITANAEAMRGEALDRRLTRAVDAAR